MAMTWTYTPTVFGNQRAHYGLVTMDAITSGALDTGLKVINGGMIVPQSQTSGVPGPLYHFNRSSAGAAANGYLQIASCTAGDTFNVCVFGY